MRDFKDVYFDNISDHPVHPENVSLVREVEFPVSKKIYKGIPLVVSGRFGLTSVQRLTKLDILSAHGPTSSTELLDYYTNCEDTHRTIFDIEVTKLDESVLFMDVYKQLVDKTKLKFVRLNLQDCSVDDGKKVIEYFRLEVPSIVLIAGPSLTTSRTQAFVKAGADVVAIGHHAGSDVRYTYTHSMGYEFGQIDFLEEQVDISGYSESPLLADLFCSSPADFNKAFVGGSTFVGIGPDTEGYCIEDILHGMKLFVAAGGSLYDYTTSYYSR